jgi:hypothetical protein
MHDYWLYLYDRSARILRAPTPITADDDETAIIQAKARLDGIDAELMDGDRLAIRLPRNHQDPRPPSL